MPQTSLRDPLRLLFFGTPDYAAASLRSLATSRHSVVGAISQPDRPRGRGRVLAPTPVHEVADEFGIPLLQAARVGDPEAVDWMQRLEPDLGVVVAFGQFIPKPVRELPRLKLINGHASLLPRHRGAAPIAHAILAGEKSTGVTVMRVEKEMDAGDFCLKRELDILPDETTGSLTARLAPLCADALLAAVEEIAAGTALFEVQDHALATLAPKLDRSFAAIDWTRPVDEVWRRIRASTPWPGVDVVLTGGSTRFRVIEARLADGAAGRGGSVFAPGSRLLICCGDGWIEICRLQVPGKRPVDAVDFLRGARIPQDAQVEPT